MLQIELAPLFARVPRTQVEILLILITLRIRLYQMMIILPKRYALLKCLNLPDWRHRYKAILSLSFIRLLA